MEYIDTANHIGRIWSASRGWHHLPFPDIPAKFVALCVNNKISGMTDREIENKLTELGFNPSYRYLGLNNPKDKNDPTSLLFFLRKYKRDDQEMDQAILTLIRGGIPPRAIVVITHKLYCAALGIGCDRSDNRL